MPRRATAGREGGRGGGGGGHLDDSDEQLDAIQPLRLQLQLLRAGGRGED
jgi:hypothetical protein